MVFCHDRAGIKLAQSLDHHIFIDKFALCLPETFHESYRVCGLIVDEERNFEQFQLFITRTLRGFERNSEIWASLPMTKTRSHDHTSTVPRVSYTEQALVVKSVARYVESTQQSTLPRP